MCSPTHRAAARIQRVVRLRISAHELARRRAARRRCRPRPSRVVAAPRDTFHVDLTPAGGLVSGCSGGWTGK
eukprot:gene32464-53460_t